MKFHKQQITISLMNLYLNSAKGHASSWDAEMMQKRNTKGRSCWHAWFQVTLLLYWHGYKVTPLQVIAKFCPCEKVLLFYSNLSTKNLKTAINLSIQYFVEWLRLVLKKLFIRLYCCRKHAMVIGQWSYPELLIPSAADAFTDTQRSFNVQNFLVSCIHQRKTWTRAGLTVSQNYQLITLGLKHDFKRH